MANFDLGEEVQLVNDRPVPKEFVMFFRDTDGPRVFLNIAGPNVWKRDLALVEKMFGEMFLIPTDERSYIDLSECQDILKQRMKYPGVKEDAEKLAIARTWVLPTKLHKGPLLQTVLGVSPLSSTKFTDVLDPFFESIKNEKKCIGLLKIELADEHKDLTRSVLFQLLDEGFRPGLILMKWGQDVDDHYPTAYMAGHLQNSGYCLAKEANGYYLYYFNDSPLYDTVSWKSEGYQNPILGNLIEQISGAFQKSSVSETKASEQQSVEAQTTDAP